MYEDSYKRKRIATSKRKHSKDDVRALKTLKDHPHVDEDSYISNSMGLKIIGHGIATSKRSHFKDDQQAL